MNSLRSSWAPLVAALGPVFFLLAFAIEGAIRPGYAPLEEYVSALSLGPRGWIQVTAFVVCGTSLLLLGAITSNTLVPSGARRAGGIMLGIIGGALLLSGPIMMDAAGTPAFQGTWHGLLHGILGGVVFLLMPAVQFVFLGQLHLPRWGWWSTLVLATVTAGADVVFIAVTKSPDLAVTAAPWVGLIQRSVLAPFMAWCVVLAFVLHSRHRDDPKPRR